MYRKGHVTVEEAKLYTLPQQLPLLIGAAVSQQTAEWMGSWADGLITIHKPLEELKATIEGFKRNGGEDRPLYLKVQLSYARSEKEALEGAYDQWRTNVLSSEILDDLWQVKQYDAAAQFVRPEDLKGPVLISSDPKQFIDWIQSYIELGFEKIILHNVNREQETFINDFSEKVLPYLKL